MASRAVSVRWGMMAAAMVAAVVVVVLSARFGRERGLDEAAEVGQRRLSLYASTIRTAIQKYEYLPFILSRDKDVLAVLTHASGALDHEGLSRRLEDIQQSAGAAAIYVMAADGMTLASSNWREKTSFVGVSYAFRPYYSNAATTGQGRYYGVGATTNQAGYFLSHAVHDGGHLVGVVVVKVDLEPLQAEWRAAGEDVLVGDEYQVTILSSRPDWKYRSLGDEFELARGQIEATRQYGENVVRPMAMSALSDRRLVAMPDDDGRSRRYVRQSLPLDELGWTIHLLSSAGESDYRGNLYGAAAASLILLTLALGIALHQRRQSLQAQLRARDAVTSALSQARDELEAAVRTRTAALRTEIAERERKERELRNTQDELVQAGKLAGLGQMSAAIAHELNQPLAAILTFVAATKAFAERGNIAQVRQNLDMLSDLAQRMAGIIGHLKTFARKSSGQPQPVVLGSAMDRALALLGPRLRADAIEVTIDNPAGAEVMADEIRLEQVLVNLFANAVDAMAQSSARRLSVSVTPGDEDDWVVRVSDSGSGIADEDMERLFDPFFTTKAVGQGLGLGLSVSYGIVRDFGGTIRAENNPGGGASFVLTLPRAAGTGDEIP